MNFVLLSVFSKLSLFLLCYILILYFKKLAIVDIFWGLSFLPEFAIALYFEGFTHGNLIMFLMVAVWSIRLSLYLGLRAKSFNEDSRYLEYSKNWPKNKFKAKVFTKIILTQFFVSTLMSSCFYVYLFSPSFGWSAPIWNVPMLMIFLFGLAIEVTSDEQIRRFKKRSYLLSTNLNKTYTGGLWSFIKYPNYLGEILIWLSFGLLALPFKYGFLSLISPLVIFYFLTYISGIPYLEPYRRSKEPYPNPRPLYNYIPYFF